MFAKHCMVVLCALGFLSAGISPLVGQADKRLKPVPKDTPLVPQVQKRTPPPPTCANNCMIKYGKKCYFIPNRNGKQAQIDQCLRKRKACLSHC